VTIPFGDNEGVGRSSSGSELQSERPLIATGIIATCFAEAEAVSFPPRLDSFDTVVNNGDLGPEGAELRLAGETVSDVDTLTGMA